MEKITISRAKWSRGKLPLNSLLISTANLLSVTDSEKEKLKVGTMCCLGFVCLAKGLTEEEIRGASYPSSTRKNIPGLTVSIRTAVEDTTFSRQAARINDDPHITEEAREYDLVRLFAANDMELTFTD